MNAKLFFLLGLAVLVARASASGYDFEGDFNKCADESDDTVDGSSDNDGNCTLYQGFEKAQSNVTLNCTTAEVAGYTTFLADIKITLASSNYSNSEKYILVSGRLDQFATAFPTCYTKIQAVNITTITNIITIQKVTIIKQQQTIFSTINVDLSDNCPLFDALREAAAATNDASAVSATNTFISTELLSICKDSSLNVTEKVSLVYQKIQEFLSSQTQIQTTITTVQITGFGFFPQFFSCAVVYQQQTDVSVLFTGVYPNIPLMTYLQAQYNSLTVAADKIKFNLFFNKVKSIFSNTTLTIEQRQTFIINAAADTAGLYYSFAYQYIFSLSCGSEFGSFWDVCFTNVCPPPFEGFPITPGTLGTTETTEVTETTSTLLPSTSSACSCTCAPDL